jgi:hypothetical protein
MTIPFTGTGLFDLGIAHSVDSLRIGSGITLYVGLTYAMGFQVSIDGGAETQFQFDGMCDPTDCEGTYNFTAYDIQSLQSGNHTLDLTLLNATGTDTFYNDNYDTDFNFDYAAVNETDAFPTRATSSTVPTSTPSTAPASTSSSAAAHTPTTSTAAAPLPAPSTQ